MLEHRAIFGPCPHAREIPAISNSDLYVRVATERGLLLLQSPAPATLQEAVSGELQLQLPAPQRANQAGECALLWLSPAEWVLELPETRADSILSALWSRLSTSLAAITDMSDALVPFEVGGARVTETLMTGCSLDLRAESFPIGQVARTAVADVPVTIWNLGSFRGFRCLVDRSLAGYFRDWLLNTAPQQPVP